MGGDDHGYDFLAGKGFEAKKGDVRAVPTDDGGTMFVVGLGKAADVDPSVLRHAAGCLARAAKGHEAIAIDLLRSLADVGDMARGAQAIPEGLALGDRKSVGWGTGVSERVN